MAQVSLTEEEMKVLLAAVRHCVDQCRQGGPQKGCEDCHTLVQVQKKLEQGNIMQK